MAEIFLRVVDRSITAGYIVLAVLVLRLLLKKAPKWINVLLWGIVAVRLLCPFSLSSVFSLLPSAATVSPDVLLGDDPRIDTGIPVLDEIVNPVISENFAPAPEASVNPLGVVTTVLAAVWIAGTVIFLLYAAVSYIRVKRRIGTAVRYGDEKNVYQSENVSSPFVLGIVKPVIYLPFRLDGKSLSPVLAHEKAHVARKDHWWKPLGFLLLAVYWFNPLTWVAYILLCRDVEFACDEKVIRTLDREARADYSQTLLDCGANRAGGVRRHLLNACPIAFGEVGVKNRVKTVLHYKKPAFWILLVALLACVVTAVCFLTVPKVAPLDAYTFEKIDGEDAYRLVAFHSDTAKVAKIPATYKGLPVREIYNEAFLRCEALTTVKIPDGVTTICIQAFCLCENLTSITIPASATWIDYSPFDGCYNLTSITYTGTKAQWDAIQPPYPGRQGDDSVAIHCTDGDISHH